MKKFATGCLPLSRKKLLEQERAIDSAVSMPEYLWQEEGDMPVIKWNKEFENWLDKRIELAERYRKKNLCLLPWEIYKALPPKIKKTEVYAWNQGSLPTCSMHGAVHAFQASLLTAIALGSPLKYEAFNPIYPFYLARGGNVSGGLDIFTTAEWANKNGFYPVSLVGSDNLRVNKGKAEEYAKEAKRYQSGIVFIEGDYEKRIVKACKALCSVCFGSGRYYTNARKDENGIKVMSGLSFGGHAQCFTGYREVNGEAYIFNQNSWGEAYGQSEEEEPASGSWVSAEERSMYWKDIEYYGSPYLVFVEGDIRNDGGIYNEFDIPKYPEEWKD